MTDLAANGALVISTPDSYHANIEAGVTEGEYYGSLRGDRPVYNVSGFFDQLGSIVASASNASGIVAGVNVTQMRIVDRGFFFIARPDGVIETRVGDFHDGVELHAPNGESVEGFIKSGPVSPEEYYFSQVSSYLRMVVKIFPQLQHPAEEFVSATFSNRTFFL